MRRSTSIFLAALMAFALGMVSAKARPLEKVSSLCAASMQEEFGAAAFKFNKLRRDEDNDRQRLFGELTLKNGKKARIRCRVRGGKVFDVRFSTGAGNSLGGQMWEAARPEGAEYVPFEDEETEENAETQGEPEAGDTEAQDTEAEGQQETAETTETAESTETAETTETEEAPQRSRFIKAPKN